jgi:hypothetical protein
MENPEDYDDQQQYWARLKKINDTRRYWRQLRTRGVYDIPMWGDLFIHAIARGSRKTLLIFNTSPKASHPVYVVCPNLFNGQTDSDVPVCLAYNGTHYESLHTVSDRDINLTKRLVQSVKDNTYANDMLDIPYLISNDEKRCQSPWPMKPPHISWRPRELRQEWLEPITSAERMQISRVNRSIDKIISDSKKDAERKRVMRSNPALKEKYNLEQAERMRQKMSNPEEKDQQNQRMRDRRSNLDFDTGFEAICCCCLEYKSRDVCTYNVTKLSDGDQEYCIKSGFTTNLDGTHTVCTTCRQSMRAKKEPIKCQRDLFGLTTFPHSFLDQVQGPNRDKDPKLNKLEQFILKPVIPFIRVAHCETHHETLKVRGNLICISADIGETMSNILPRDQNILPISFKRKLVYNGHYLAEFVDKEKVNK